MRSATASRVPSPAVPAAGAASRTPDQAVTGGLAVNAEDLSTGRAWPTAIEVAEGVDDLRFGLHAAASISRAAKTTTHVQLQPVGHCAQRSGQHHRRSDGEGAACSPIPLDQRERDPRIRFALRAGRPAHHGGGDLLSRIPGPGVIPVQDPWSTLGRDQHITGHLVAVGYHQRHGLGRLAAANASTSASTGKAARRRAAHPSPAWSARSASPRQ